MAANLDRECVYHAFCWAWYVSIRCFLHLRANSSPETTAHSIAATLGFLAVFDKLQEEIYKQIISVMGYKRHPVLFFFHLARGTGLTALQVYDDYSKLNKVLAAFLEALRMFRTHHSFFLLLTCK